MSLYLSRLTISRNASALKALIDPQADDAHDNLHHHALGRTMNAHHGLIWTLFGDTPDRTRDFLWHAEGKGRFLILSTRPPENRLGLFDAPEVKEFSPDLRPGDHLSFVLRANATRSLRSIASSKKRGERVDVVMDAIYKLPSGEERKQARLAKAQEAGEAWFERQGEKGGFKIQQCAVTDYSVVPLPSYRGPRSEQPQFGVINVTGMICVTDPVLLIGQITQGFGRAKAFGCGLMLIRRA